MSFPVFLSREQATQNEAFYKPVFEMGVDQYLPGEILASFFLL